MDFGESTRIVFNRIKKLEPENVTKIIGYLLLQEDAEQEMINLSMSPDVVVQEVIYKAKAELHLLGRVNSSAPESLNSPPSSRFSPFLSNSGRTFSAPAAFQVSPPYWKTQVAAKHNVDGMPMGGYLDPVSELENQTQFLSLEDQLETVNMAGMGSPNEYFLSDAVAGNLGVRRGRRFSLNEFPIRTCHYFNKGFCKHGSNCRYYHGQVSEGFPQMFDVLNEDRMFSPGSLSLDRLELEIVELLKSRKGNPVSIASLPMIYYEKYGKVLQAEGYLTESQRHGKAGYSLTKLLARLKTNIRLIDRPHGQHAVILAEDAPKYMGFFSDRNDPGPIVSGSRQIYLTFPAESTFTEEDVSNYFSTFGPVEDVRIPCQQRRMFGFVTFENAETVQLVLKKGNPHFVCDARVLVKPYREKSKLIDRKYHERMEPPLYSPPPYIDMDNELQSSPTEYDNLRFKMRLMEERQGQALELQRGKRLTELQIARNEMAGSPITNQSYSGYFMDGVKVSEDYFDVPSAIRFNYLLDVLNSETDAKAKDVETTDYTDLVSQGLNLPDSPFASPR